MISILRRLVLKTNININLQKRISWNFVKIKMNIEYPIIIVLVSPYVSSLVCTTITPCQYLINNELNTWLLDAILYLSKSQIRPKIEHCCDICARATQLSLSSLDRVQRRLRVVVGDKLFSTLQPSLLYRYFNGKCSDEIRSLVPPVLNFTARTRHATHIAENHPHSLHIPLARCWVSFFLIVPTSQTCFSCLLIFFVLF